MKPLASAVTEFRLTAALSTLGGVALAIAAVATDDPVAAVVEVLLIAAFAGGGMYLWVYRSAANRAVKDPPPAPMDELESAPATARRVVRTAAPLLAAALLGVALGEPHLVAGALLGHGALLWLTGRMFEQWEARTGRRLLHEPRQRWRAEGRHGWARGVGSMDPRTSTRNVPVRSRRARPAEAPKTAQ